MPPSTQVTRDQFEWDGDRLTHIPTGARFNARSDWVNYGRAGEILPNGDDFERSDVLKVAKQIVDERLRR